MAQGSGSRAGGGGGAGKVLVGIVMGSKSDFETMKHAGETLASFSTYRTVRESPALGRIESSNGGHMAAGLESLHYLN